MTTTEDLPDPNNCLWCTQARNCSTKSFSSKELLNNTGSVHSWECDCGHQSIPSWADGEDVPDEIPHTKLCKEHTIRWMQKIINLKLSFDAKDR